MVTTPEATKQRSRRRYAPRRPTQASRRDTGFRNPYIASRRGPSIKQVLLFLALLLGLLAIDAIYVATSIQSPLRETAQYLDEGADALQEGDVPAARVAFAKAVRESRTADSLAARPSVYIASLTPWLARDADAIRALTRAGRLFAVAGTRATDAIEVLGGTSRDEIAAALYNDGRLQFDTIADAQASLALVAGNLGEARSVLAETSLPRNQRLADALETAQDRIAAVEPRAAAAARFMDALPRIMGRDELRTYFVALQAQSEARATGGSIGLYGLMEADQGRIRLTHVGPSFELAEDPKQPLTSGILLPPWYAARYGDEVTLGNVNRSPHFPLAARSILKMYRNATGRSLDGVWSFDPVAFQDITAATGPLTGPGYDVALGPDNAAKVLLQDVYQHFGADFTGQTKFLAGIIQDLYDRLGSSQADTARLFEGLAQAAAANHLQIYSTDPTEQQALVDLGVDGGLDLDGPPGQMVFHNNLGGNNVDYFLRRTINTTIQLDAEGGAEITTVIDLVNQAPDGPPSLLLGYRESGQRPGFNRMELNVVLPRRAARVTGEIDGRVSILRLGEEGTFPLASLDVEMPAGSQRRVTITYTIDDVQRFVESGRDFSFLLTPQPTAIPDRYAVTVIAPDGYSLTRGGPSSTGRLRDSLRFTGDLDLATTISVGVVRG